MKNLGITKNIYSVFRKPKEIYGCVMSIKSSPLKHFDPITAHIVFQILALLWSLVFAAMLGSYLAFGVSAIFHILLISGVLSTVLVFREANKKDFVSNITGYNGRSFGGEHE